ncbi:MAG: P-loop NTPase [Erythrobacter sp.]
MTKHSPIDQGTPTRSSRKRSSLFERADAAFGLDGMGPAAVPSDLPETGSRVHQAVRSATEADLRQQAPATEPQYQGESADAKPRPQAHPEPQPEPRVSLCGPHAKIDRDVLRKAGLIVPEDPVTGLLEEFRIIKRELLADARAAHNAEAQRILICSPHSGDGKTFCASNLAIALSAERDVEVLLIDADVMKPSITRRFGIGGELGFMDAIVDHGQRPEELAMSTDIEGLFIMSAGSSSARDAEYLASARTGQVLDRLTRGAPNRFVIFDTPPALAASPAAELASHVGQAVLVARADDTSRAALEDAQQLLSACPDIKLLLNAAQFSPSGRRFGEYYGEEED